MCAAAEGLVEADEGLGLFKPIADTVISVLGRRNTLSKIPFAVFMRQKFSPAGESVQDLPAFFVSMFPI